MSKKSTSWITRTLIRILLAIYSLSIVIPFIYMLMNSFKTSREFYADIWSWPANIDLTNYIAAVEKTQLQMFTLNTFYVCIAAVALTLAMASMLSYVITRLNVKWGGKLYKYFLVGLLIPQIIAILPLFMIARVLGLYNTRAILIIAYSIFELPFAVFVLTAFFKTLPQELEQAAKIDGAGYFATFMKIIVPLAKPGMITVGVFAFLDYWNEYILPLTLIVDDAKKTVSMAILKLQVATSVKQDWGALFAACILVVVPVLIIYGIFQRNLTEGLTAGSIKG
jgi:N-acetylglucosamine transport system permease protein